MKKNYLFPVLILAVSVLVAATLPFKKTGPYGLTKGTPDLRSISALSFGKDGIIFIGDSKGATVFALDTRDAKNNDKASPIAVPDIDQKIATALGTQKENIAIMDMAVNPVSKKLYVAIQYVDGTPILLRVDNDKIEPVSIKDVYFSTRCLSSNNIVRLRHIASPVHLTLMVYLDLN